MKSNVDGRLRLVFWLMAIVLGVFQAWGSRHLMDSDGISYLDHGDAFFRGEWGTAVNPYWSPLYSWLLGLALFLVKPSPYWEYSVVHLVNFLIYVGALGAFEFFLQELIRRQQIRQEKIAREGFAIFSSWACQIIGYTLFIWSSLFLITIREVTPDMSIAAFVYLATGLLLRIHRGGTTWLTFVSLRVTLGLGYLVKSPMFPLSLIFLSVCLFSAGQIKKAWPRTLLAFAVFALIASPYFLTISRTMGRLTFGDSSRWHYIWYINKDPSSYPNIRKIFEAPPVYEFGTPIQGTYPIWFDPAYWSREMAPHYFDLKGLAHIVMLNAKRYYAIFFSSQAYFIACLLLLFYMSRRRWLGIKDIAENWIFLLPATAALGMYALAPVFTRYIGSFVTLFWLGVFLGIRLPDARESRRLLAGITLALTTMMTLQVAREEVPLARTTLRELVRGEKPTAHLSWLVARQLNRMEIKPGDRVASIGSYYTPFWARLARLRIVAEIPHTESSSFWTAGPRVRSRILKVFASTGAKVLVAERVPPHASTKGWQRIEDTDFFVRLL